MSYKFIRAFRFLLIFYFYLFTFYILSVLNHTTVQLFFDFQQYFFRIFIFFSVNKLRKLNLQFQCLILFHLNPRLDPISAPPHFLHHLAQIPASWFLVSVFDSCQCFLRADIFAQFLLRKFRRSSCPADQLCVDLKIPDHMVKQAVIFKRDAMVTFQFQNARTFLTQQLDEFCVTILFFQNFCILLQNFRHIKQFSFFPQIFQCRFCYHFQISILFPVLACFCFQ